MRTVVVSGDTFPLLVDRNVADQISTVAGLMPELADAVEAAVCELA